MATAMMETSGPIEYYNRVQYFGENVFAETHTAVMLDEEKNHPKALGMAIEVLAVCTLNDDGLIVRFEEFADDAPRPSPFTAEEVKRDGPPLSYSGTHTTPDAAVPYTGSCTPALAQKNIGLLFDGIMGNDDVSHLWNESPVSAQLFGPWNGKLVEMKRYSFLMNCPRIPFGFLGFQ